jgi:quinol monooxygenase YgiN
MSVVSIVRHHVADFEAWKKVYDSVAPMQKAGGVLAHGVFRSEQNPNDVTVLHTFADSATAHAFFESPELRAALGNAGVDMATFKLDFANEIAFGRL